MDDQAVEEASRLGVLESLQHGPASAEHLCSSLGISERVAGSLLERLVAQGVVEEVAGSVAPSPTFRLAQQRRRGRGGAGAQPRNGRTPGQPGPGASHQAMQQQAYMAGMVPYGYAPFHTQQLLYYPGPYQQQHMGGGGGPPWHRPSMPGGQRPPHGQQGGPNGGMQMGVVPPQHLAGYAMQPFYFAAPGAAMAAQPPTPTGPAPQQRAATMVRAGSDGSASNGGTGWGGVPLAQPAAEAAAVLSPRTAAVVDGLDGAAPPPPASNGCEEGKKGAPSKAASGDEGRRGVTRPAADGADPAAPLAPGSSDSSSEEGGEARPRPASLTANGSSSGEEGPSGGGRRRTSSSSGGSSRSSRRSRGSRERQPCAFFLKTGTCAYGDSCKFAHPFDQAPRVEFNSVGLPLRPGEPECSFYMKNYRCAFGHTCKFHHPEVAAVPSSPVPPMQYMQYMQYQQAAGSPMLNAVLGVKPGPVAAPPSPMAASPVGPGQAFFMPPYAGAPHAYHGRAAALHAGFAGQMAGPPPAPRGAMQRAGSGNSKAAAAAAAAAAANAMALPLPVGLPQPAGPRPDAASSSPSTPVEQLATPLPAQASPAAAQPSPPPMPQPIMVFNGQQGRAQQLASALHQLDLTAGEAASGGSTGDGLAGSRPHKPQQQDVLAAA